jgi:hypothetical protein
MVSFFLFGGKVFLPGITSYLASQFLYLGPDTIMPLASILAAVLGFLLLFWRYIINFIKKIFRRGKTTSNEIEEDSLVDPDLVVSQSQDIPQNPSNDKPSQI